MATWQLQDASEKLKEVIALAEAERPQIMMQDRVEVAVIVGIEGWQLF